MTTAIRTQRFVLEPLRPAHADEMVQVLADPALYEFIGGTPPTLEELEQRYARQLAGPGVPTKAWLNWIVRRPEDGRALGFVQATLSQRDDEWTADLAWLVGTEFQGNGIATEATSGAVEHLRGHGVRHFTAHIAEGHRASARVAEHLGLSRTDVVDTDGERVYANA